ncbi:MAG: hypothetical protein WDN24_03610 [Sphingomonas sp.]
MLREWSDREPPPKRRRFFGSGEFLLGAASTLIGLLIVLGFLV